MIPARFVTPRATLLVDRFMTSFIKIGGIGIILAVFAICVFILLQVLPLFRSAQVEPVAGHAEIDIATQLAPGATVVALGNDEWGDNPFVVADDGKLIFAGGATAVAGSNLTGGRRITAASYDIKHQRLALGTAGGNVVPVTIASQATMKDRVRSVVSTATPGDALVVAAGDAVVHGVAWAEHEDDRLVAAIVEQAGARQLKVQYGAASNPVADLTNLLTGTPDQVLVDDHLDSVVVISQQGDVTYLFRTGDSFTARQVFKPFADTKDQHISSAFYLLGDVSLVMTNPEGINRQFSLFIHKGDDARRFGMTKEFEPLPAGARFGAISVRNKAFLVGTAHHASLRYGTSAATRWSEDLPYTPSFGVMNSKYTRITLLGDDNRLRCYSLDDPHPESGWAAFFGKVWYEGFAEPKYEWQSTGGTDDFEPKLSMVNLIFGTFKATFYALLFAVPIAMFAAIYTAEFMHPRFKSVVKPTVEIMASLPSVVLGFLAALWLAPMIEERFPSVLVMGLMVPSFTCLIGFGWSRLSPATRSGIPQGWEFILLIPLLIVVSVIAWNLGPALERAIFTVKLDDGSTIADFRRWWSITTGMPYEQRNSLVVGVMMGFAVIPIIFTIAEDALSNVPSNLRSASLALGASRWQTAFRVVVPTASAGIFSALMIGLGRAIGETMIVVMATGNTGIIDMNIFNGMRTLSANIAVELPEAPHGSTLYRALFLGALLLFIFTFAVNTVAEVLRARLREKYKTV